MKRKDHTALARYLLDSEAGREHWKSPLRRRLFLCGCISPDYLPTTYLCGFFKKGAMQGHHEKNSKRKIERLILRLRDGKPHRAWNCYRLGILIHYVADSFTYVHTEGFEGSIREHRRYERVLHHCFGGFLGEGKKAAHPCGEGSSGADLLVVLRAAYEAEPVSTERDCRHIVASCQALFSGIEKL